MNTKKTNDCKVIALAIQKGGVAKTTSSIAMSAVLAEQGYKVLLIDNDPQHNATRSLVKFQRGKAYVSISDIIDDLINFRTFDKFKGIITTEEGFDILPSSDSYAGIEFKMISLMNREYFIRTYVNMVRDEYDFIVIDCPPNLGMLTINALTASDVLLIPAQPQEYSATSIQQVLNTVKMVQHIPNPSLTIGGIFLTMYNARRNEDNYMRQSIAVAFKDVTLYETTIPYSVRVAEAARHKQSITKFNKNGTVAEAYKELVKEVFNIG